MKKLVTLLVLFFAFTVFSQDTYFQKGNDKQEEKAKKLTEKYDLQLSMSGEQRLLFQKKVTEFLIRAEDVKEKYKGKEKLDLLYALQKNETAEMQDILTRPQHNLYVKIRDNLQPLATVEK